MPPPQVFAISSDILEQQIYNFETYVIDCIGVMQAQPSTIVPQSLNFDDSSLPGGVIAAIALPPSLDPGQLDLYGDLYGGNGKGKTLLETQVAQVHDYSRSKFI